VSSMFKINALIGVMLFLSSCDGGVDAPQPTNSQAADAAPQQIQQVRNEPGLLEHMAGAAVAGAAAGSAGAVAHKVTDHVISKRQEKRSARRAHARGRRH